MKTDEIFEERLKRHHDELRWLYMELYDNGDMFAELCEKLHAFALEREQYLMELDREREQNPEWFR